MVRQNKLNMVAESGEEGIMMINKFKCNSELGNWSKLLLITSMGPCFGGVRERK